MNCRVIKMSYMRVISKKLGKLLVSKIYTLFMQALNIQTLIPALMRMHKLFTSIISLSKTLSRSKMKMYFIKSVR
jgi:hypothetical protein